MTSDVLIIWLILGFVPYRVYKQHLPGGIHRIEIDALFWTFNVKQRPSGRHDWTLRISIIEKLRRSVWMAVMQFKGSNSSKKTAQLDED